jgi:hypothetical protein
MMLCGGLTPGLRRSSPHSGVKYRIRGTIMFAYGKGGVAPATIGTFMFASLITQAVRFAITYFTRHIIPPRIISPFSPPFAPTFLTNAPTQHTFRHILPKFATFSCPRQYSAEIRVKH